MAEISYSFFDFDNTLYKGQSGYLIQDFSIYLDSKKAFDHKRLCQILILVASYEAGQLSRHDFAEQIVQAFYEGLTGRTEDQIDELAKDYWRNISKEAWFPYTVPLLKLVKEYSIPILISGSPIEVLKHLSGSFGFHAIYASMGKKQKGEFQGGMHRELASQLAKKQFMTELIPTLNIDRKTSLAFGDSESDFPLLEAVDPLNAYFLVVDQHFRDGKGNQPWNFLEKNLKIVDHVLKRLNSFQSNPD